MKEATQGASLGFLVGLIVGLLVTGWIAAGVNSTAWERDTVARGLAQHCPNTGVWAWKGECGDR